MGETKTNHVFVKERRGIESLVWAKRAHLLAEQSIGDSEMYGPDSDCKCCSFERC